MAGTRDAGSGAWHPVLQAKPRGSSSLKAIVGRRSAQLSQLCVGSRRAWPCPERGRQVPAGPERGSQLLVISQRRELPAPRPGLRAPSLPGLFTNELFYFPKRKDAACSSMGKRHEASLVPEGGMAGGWRPFLRHYRTFRSFCLALSLPPRVSISRAPTVRLAVRTREQQTRRPVLCGRQAPRPGTLL